MKPIGLTGNIGCGKSTVARLLNQNADVTHFDTDRMAKEILADSHHQQDIESILGAHLLTNGALDTKKIGRIVFNDRQKLHQLTAFCSARIWDQILSFVASTDPDRLVIVESAILFETENQPRYRTIVVAHCADDVRRQRLRTFRGMTDQDIDERLQYQLPQEEKVARADILIDTDCSLDELSQRVAHLYRHLKTPKEKSHD